MEFSTTETSKLPAPEVKEEEAKEDNEDESSSMNWVFKFRCLIY